MVSIKHAVGPQTYIYGLQTAKKYGLHVTDLDLHGLRLTKQGKKCWLQITSYCCSRSLFFTTLIAKPDSLKGLENITLQAVRSAGICIECTECDHSYDATEP